MILDRIRANGGEVIRDRWRFALRRGRLTDAHVAWLRANWRRVVAEVWPEHDAFEERAAIREYAGGQPRAEAERDAYAEGGEC
ncbi:MAG: hypothetical protein IPM60_15155 [Rhodospirillales bacterium]|nr:hypothetical protein [Rhodospirillales bacterium]